MKKQIGKIIGIIAAIGLLMTACDNGNDNGDDGISMIVQSTDGSLTITGLNAYNNRYVISLAGLVSSADNPQNYPTQLVAASNISNSYTLTGANIVNNQATLKVWRVISTTTIGNFNGNGDASFSWVVITDKEHITADDQQAFFNYASYGHAKPSWVFEIGFVIAENMSNGIGSGAFFMIE